MKCHALFPRCLFPHLVTVGRRPLPAVQLRPPGLPAHLRCYAALPPPLAVLLCTPCPCAFPACAGRCSPRRTPCIGALAACALADARRPALLALAPSPLVLADARPATLLALLLLPFPPSFDDISRKEQKQSLKYFRYGTASCHCATVYRHMYMRGRANAPPCCSWGSL